GQHGADHAVDHQSQEHDGDDHAGVHESPNIMVMPLAVLAALSVIGGFIGLPHFSWLEKWLEPVIPVHEAASAAIGGGMEWALMGLSAGLAGVGIAAAFLMYRNLAAAEAWAKRLAPIHKLLDNKWYIDEIYQGLIVNPIRRLSELLWKGFDVNVLDRIVLGFGRASNWTGQTVRVIQTGSIQIYALMLLIGIVATVGYLLYGML
ncbi:MAG: NADH-quinone oxidoreductase subunit L, partial [Bdellovibrionota bacterium]